MKMTTFKSRKTYGNSSQLQFERWCDSNYTKNDCFALDDFVTTTSNMEEVEKYQPDYYLPETDTYVEVKVGAWDCLCNWEQHECDWQRGNIPNLLLWVDNKYYMPEELRYVWKKGKPNWSGDDYYKVYKI
jgi:hypothetical protein